MDFSEKDKLVNINDIKAGFFDKLLEYAYQDEYDAEDVLMKLFAFEESVTVIEENNNIM